MSYYKFLIYIVVFLVYIDLKYIKWIRMRIKKLNKDEFNIFLNTVNDFVFSFRINDKSFLSYIIFHELAYICVFTFWIFQTMLMTHIVIVFPRFLPFALYPPFEKFIAGALITATSPTRMMLFIKYRKSLSLDDIDCKLCWYILYIATFNSIFILYTLLLLIAYPYI